MRIPTSATVAGALAAGCVVLAGCGGSADPVDPGVTPLSDSLPACADVWVEGASLPEDYAGCVDDDGVLQASVSQKCTSVDGSLTTYADTYFVFQNGRVRAGGAEDPAYQQAYGVCFGAGW